LHDGAESFTELPEELIAEGLEQNLHLLPRETFVYDEWRGKHVEKMLDNVSFYNEMDIGMTLDEFTFARELKHWVPVSTYNMGDDFTQEEEFVAYAEGTVLPLFCFGYRLDKIQYGFHAMNGEGQAKVDHSKKSIQHA